MNRGVGGGLLDRLFGAPETTLPLDVDAVVRQAEREVRVDRAVAEAAEVSDQMHHLSETLAILLQEYRRVREP